MQVDAGAEVIVTQPPLFWDKFEAWINEIQRYALERARCLWYPQHAIWNLTCGLSTNACSDISLETIGCAACGCMTVLYILSSLFQPS